MWSYECPESSIFIQYDTREFAENTVSKWPSQIAVLAPKMKKLSKFVGPGQIAGRESNRPTPMPMPAGSNAYAGPGPCANADAGHGSNADAGNAADARRQRGWQATCASATSRRAVQEGEERTDGGQCRHRNRLGLNVRMCLYGYRGRGVSGRKLQTWRSRKRSASRVKIAPFASPTRAPHNTTNKMPPRRRRAIGLPGDDSGDEDYRPSGSEEETSRSPSNGAVRVDPLGRSEVVSLPPPPRRRQSRNAGRYVFRR